jgi:hypothetical protein
MPVVDADYCKFPHWNVLRWRSTVAKVWLCELG